VQQYNNPWKKELDQLHSIISKTVLKPVIKWGAIVFTHQGRNVISYGGFKNFFTLWFYNGVFLGDKYQVLVNAQDGKTKALRQWRFTSAEEINEERILEYIQEAILNEEAGKVWKPKKSTPVALPGSLKTLFASNPNLKLAFESLTPYKQKEYIEYIDSAKREETKMVRLQKIEPMILRGIGLSDKYK